MKKNPFKHTFDKIASMVQMIEDNRKTPVSEALPNDVFDRLNKLENDVNLFCSINNSILLDANISNEEIEEILQSPPDSFTKENKLFLDTVSKLKKDIESLHHEIVLQSEQIKAKEKISDKKDSKRSSIEKRKKKFRGVGGYKGWLPL